MGMERRFFYIKNLTTGQYHRGATYGGHWGKLPQFFSRRRDAQYRLSDLQARQIRWQNEGYTDKEKTPPDDIRILETVITWD